MEDGDGGHGDGNEQFHRNEAISAVADEGFLAEEEDDYEDLYNDVNVGEGFLQTLRKNEDIGFRNGDREKERKAETTVESNAVSAPVSIPGVGREVKMEKKGVPEAVSRAPPARVEGFQDSGFRVNEMVQTGPVGGGGMRVELGQNSGRVGEMGGQIVSNSNNMQNQVVATAGNEGLARQGVVGGVENPNVNVGNANGNGNMSGGGGGGGGTILFAGELHWWTTDAELESELSKYGQVKEVKFFDEKASGKSKGYCQVEFYDPAAATACKEGMNGHVFNGRPCVVAYASPYSVRKMGEAQVNKNQAMAQASFSQGRRGVADNAGRGNSIATGGNYQGGDGGRNYGRGGWARGGGHGQGMANRGQVGPVRNRIGMGGRGIIGNNGNGFGQGLSATPPLLHPQTMMGQGFDPSYGAMGRMAGYGGFPGGPTPPFSGILPSFPPVGGVGLPGVAPHVNPAFFGRGMHANGMGMMPTTGVEGQNAGMWQDPSMSGWGADEHGGRAGESSYGEDAASDHQYGEVNRERGGYATKEKERVPERELSGASDRRYRDDREPGWDRDGPRDKDPGPDQDWPDRRHRDDREMAWERERERERERNHRDRDCDRGHDRDRYRDDRDRYSDHHRYREREPDHDDEWERGRSLRTRSKSRISQEDEQRLRPRDIEHGKRRRLPSE